MNEFLGRCAHHFARWFDKGTALVLIFVVWLLMDPNIINQASDKNLEFIKYVCRYRPSYIGGMIESFARGLHLESWLLWVEVTLVVKVVRRGLLSFFRTKRKPAESATAPTESPSPP